jgi:hypothetical protein
VNNGNINKYIMLRASMNVKKIATYGILICGTALALQRAPYELEKYLQVKADHNKAKEVLAQITPADAIAPLPFQTKVQRIADEVYTTKSHTVLRSAEWCLPCKELEACLDQTGTHPDNLIMANSDAGINYTRRTFAQKGIYLPPAIPAITKNVNGFVTTYTGFIPGRNIMFDPDKNPVELEKILKKD